MHWLRMPSLAIVAIIARLAWIDGNAHARRDRADGAADLHDFSCDLVSEHHRFLDANGAEAAVIEIMQIGAADAAGLDGDADVARAGGNRRDRSRSADPSVRG